MVTIGRRGSSRLTQQVRRMSKRKKVFTIYERHFAILENIPRVNSAMRKFVHPTSSKRARSVLCGEETEWGSKDNGKAHNHIVRNVGASAPRLKAWSLSGTEFTGHRSPESLYNPHKRDLPILEADHTNAGTYRREWGDPKTRIAASELRGERPGRRPSKIS